ncbi:V-type proton ATPase subunit a1 [Camellia lanceoleosa]|uniref:V-type proton ATPase subunit a1 n=1 Tax=Camellia lanceoleosa TaxID=1840588 RepID=A0ACC0F5N7_9ERIC|nr:V-type proton ATPase subunit a1 [Camellia lanceoleosa]
MEYIDNLPPMDLMRSEKMVFILLIMPFESAQRAISYLGELGLLQFSDLNADKSPFQRTFVNQVKRCAEMSRKLRFFKDQIQKAGLMSSVHPVLQPDVELEELELQLAERELELIEMNNNSEKLQQTYNELLEFKMVLQKASDFVSSKSHAVAEERELDDHVYSNDVYADTASLLEQEMQPGPSNQLGLRFISGIISKSKALRFELMLFRATKGNMLFNQAPTNEQILDPISTEVCSSREQAKTKILKICEAFGANCYSAPRYNETEATNSRSMLHLDAGTHHLNKALTSIDFTVYDTLNMLNFDVTKNVLLGRVGNRERLQLIKNSQVGIIFHTMDAVEPPPTYFVTNHFTNAFQKLLIVARYQEANPAVYTVITFPLFRCDVWGLGSWNMLVVGSRVLLAHESKLGSQLYGDAIWCRYVLLLMSLFSIYCDPYPFGVDPSWRGSRTELPFLNSLKMKMSILLGVFQMNLGIIISYFNAVSLATQWIFDDLSKQPFWVSITSHYHQVVHRSQADLYHVMIYMFLSPFEDLGENQLFWGQRVLQRFQGRIYGMLGTSEMMDLDAEPDSARQHYEEFNFSEVFVHQMIHSIEFVLGMINIIIRLVANGVFAFATAFILLMMETLSAFFMPYALHWVEFQNKFYHGDGYKFKPFSLLYYI